MVTASNGAPSDLDHTGSQAITLRLCLKRRYMTRLTVAAEGINEHTNTEVFRHLLA